MTNNKKADGVCKPQTALKSFSALHYNPKKTLLKATVYKLAPWLFLVGVLHG